MPIDPAYTNIPFGAVPRRPSDSYGRDLSDEQMQAHRKDRDDLDDDEDRGIFDAITKAGFPDAAQSFFRENLQGIRDAIPGLGGRKKRQPLALGPPPGPYKGPYGGL